MMSEIQQFDVCIVCALAEEAKAFLEVVEQQCNVTFEKRFDPEHRYNDSPVLATWDIRSNIRWLYE